MKFNKLDKLKQSKKFPRSVSSDVKPAEEFTTHAINTEVLIDEIYEELKDSSESKLKELKAVFRHKFFSIEDKHGINSKEYLNALFNLRIIAYLLDDTLNIDHDVLKKSL